MSRSRPVGFRYSISCIPLLLLGLSLQGQNMVPNPDFSEHTWCPLGRGVIGWAVPWFSPNRNTTDYAHTCAGEDSYSGVPANRWGWQYPALGDGYAGIRTYISTEFFVNGQDYREYLAVELLDTMIQGQTYLMSFKYSVGDSAAFFSDDLGIYISKDTIPALNTLRFTPVIANPEGNILRNTEEWAELSGSYTAKGGEKYLVIGNFKDDAHTTLEQRPEDPSYYLTTYFYIDDVRVEPCGPLFPEKLALVEETEICPGESIDLIAVEIDSARYTWENGSNELARTVSAPATYTLTVQVDECVRTDSIHISPADAPLVALGRDTVLCPGEQLTLAFDKNTADTFMWNTLSSSDTLEIRDPGMYVLEARKGDCIVSDSIRVSYEIPQGDIPGIDTVKCENEPLLLMATVPSATYTWQDQSNQQVFEAVRGGTYWVTAQTICFESRQEFYVQDQKCGCESRVPNVFSPNGDGIHDSFVPVLNAGTSHFHIEVFDRWGNSVFQSDDSMYYWQGSYKGEMLAEGVYFYVLRYGCLEDGAQRMKTKRGSVTVLR